MTPRIAHQREHNGGLYMVSKTCPRPIPGGRPFYACVAGVRVEGALEALILAKCEHVLDGKVHLIDGNAVSMDRQVVCTYGCQAPAAGAQFGVPTVSHANVIDVSDGGDKD